MPARTTLRCRAVVPAETRLRRFQFEFDALTETEREVLDATAKLFGTRLAQNPNFRVDPGLGRVAGTQTD